MACGGIDAKGGALGQPFRLVVRRRPASMSRLHTITGASATIDSLSRRDQSRFCDREHGAITASKRSRRHVFPRHVQRRSPDFPSFFRDDLTPGKTNILPVLVILVARGISPGHHRECALPIAPVTICSALVCDCTTITILAGNSAAGTAPVVHARFLQSCRSHTI